MKESHEVAIVLQNKERHKLRLKTHQWVHQRGGFSELERLVYWPKMLLNFCVGGSFLSWW